MLKRCLHWTAAALALGLAGGCRMTPPGGSAGGKAYADLAPIGDSGVTGRAVFTQQKGSVKVEVELQGLKPGKHGIHLHEQGACGDRGQEAGAHFDPDDHAHGEAAARQSHRGDLGNITAGSDGKAQLSLDHPYLSLEGPESAIGRSFIVHADPDDLIGQPSGNSGARIACGVIVGGKP
jgi:superoxide dismutase, Cu-Zn family